MLELLNSPPFARQRRLPPSVYLDHWAIRRFSSDRSLGNRLTAAIAARAGTLVLSWANIAEFLAMDEHTQAAGETEQLIEANWPRLYFIRPDPFLVAQREDQRRAQTLWEDPESDQQLMAVPIFNTRPSGVIAPWTAGMFTSVMKAKMRLEPGAVNLKSSVSTVARQRLDAARANPAQMQRIEQGPSQPYRTRATLSLAELFMRQFARDQLAVFDENDVFDLLHAAVPMAYCDFVLVDKKWCAHARTVTAALRSANPTVPLAKVYSGRQGELEEFLAALEA